MQRKVVILLLASVLLLSSHIDFVISKDQQITVIGQVICDKRSMRNVNVELREHDTFDPDDSLNTTHTDKDGHFRLFGHEDETGAIKPYIRITHNCDVSKKGSCKRVTDFEVPASKVGENTVYEMNFVNLNLRGNEDKETCD